MRQRPRKPRKSKLSIEEIRSLKEAGHTYAEIGKMAGINRTSVAGLLAPTDTERKQILGQLGSRCQRCGREQASIHIHHNSYLNNTDIKLLCGKCHRAEHPRRSNAGGRTRIGTPAARPSVRISPREWDTLIGICIGETGLQTAKRIGVGKRTQGTHRFRLLKKLRAKTSGQAVYHAVLLGLIKPTFVLTGAALHGQSTTPIPCR